MRNRVAARVEQRRWKPQRQAPDKGSRLEPLASACDAAREGAARGDVTSAVAQRCTRVGEWGESEVKPQPRDRDTLVCVALMWHSSSKYLRAPPSKAEICRKGDRVD